MLGVKGRSMMGEDGILDGDQIIVVPYPEPKGEGEIVVAAVNGEETVKRLWRQGNTWRLQPSNPEFEEIPLKEGDRITGRVIGVVRWSIKPARDG
jgi:SOS-response transcriptional repressor LexA